MNILLLGAPGSGKGTLGEKIVKLGYTAIVAGDILRNERESDSELGNRIKEIMGKGNLLPDEITNEIIASRLPLINPPYLLDGFPRKVSQAVFFETISNVDLVINLTITDEILRERILKRGKTSGRADDQSIEIINNRIEQYNTETFPLVDYFTKKIGTYVVTIDTDTTPENVYEKFMVVYETMKNG